MQNQFKVSRVVMMGELEDYSGKFLVYLKNGYIIKVLYQQLVFMEVLII